MEIINKIPNLISALYQEIQEREVPVAYNLFHKTISYNICVYIFLFLAYRDKANAIVYVFSFLDSSSFSELPQQISQMSQMGENPANIVTGTR